MSRFGGQDPSLLGSMMEAAPPDAGDGRQVRVPEVGAPRSALKGHFVFISSPFLGSKRIIFRGRYFSPDWVIGGS